MWKRLEKKNTFVQYIAETFQQNMEQFIAVANLNVF